LSLERFFKRGVTSLLRFFLRSRISPPPHPEAVKSILIVRQHNQLGDMLCVVPLLRALRRKYPDAHLALMASPVNADIMRDNRYLDEVILYDKKTILDRRRFHLLVLLRFVRELRNKRFSIAIVPSTVSTSFTSDLLAYLSGARCRIGAGSLSGVGNPSAFLFTIPETLDWASEPDRHQTLRNIDNARSLELVLDDQTLEMTLSEREEEEGRKYVKEVRQSHRRAIGFHPGAGKVPNRWPADFFAALINELVPEFDAAAVVTCGPMDMDQVRAVEKGLNFPYHLIVNQEIRRVASILKSLDLVITNDTGIMHVAAAVGAPVLSLFGPTSPEQWAPQGDRNRYIQGRGGDIRTISVESVLENVRSMICS
jgi:ADP-heptose:LPS heptosyltransferase